MIKMTKSPKVLVPVACGTEEMEAVIIIDILRRAQWDVAVAGIDTGLITASRGVRIMPDMYWEEVQPSDFDVLMIPGGAPGVERFIHFEPLLATIRDFSQKKKWIGAVCAGPLTLQAAGILKGRKVTCHPGVAAKLTTTLRCEERTVVDEFIVTSQGAGTTFDFALTLISLIEPGEKAQLIADAIVLDGQFGSVISRT